jgi:lysophospholipase L1-like esterase
MKSISFGCASFRVSVLALVFLLAGCGGGSDGGLTNKNPGDNDLNVVVAFGDSITKGSECPCTPYPARLSPMIGKIVYNTGVPGSRAQNSVDRTQSAINKYRPAFMLILYGINDIIMSFGIDGTVASINQMVVICKENSVVPVLATYPLPIEGRALFAYNVSLLNDGIRQVAKAEGIKLVDLEKEFREDPSLYMGDGLHPNEAGTQIVAMAFADLF